MLALFKSKKYSKEELHEDLIKSWSEYYIKCYNYQKGKTSEYSINGMNAIDALNKLRLYGLGESRNAKEIENLIIQSKKIKEQKISSEYEYKFVKTLKSYFPNAILIPYSKLFCILEKFDLSCGPISIYNGLIPDENIDEIIDVQKKLNNFNKVNPDYNFCENYGFHWIKEVTVSHREIKLSEIRNIIRKLGRFPYFRQDRTGCIMIESIEDSYISYLHNMNTVNLNKSDWVIIAPSKDIKENIKIRVYASSKYKEKDLVDDPLACKITDFGLVSFTSWGEEANNSIFDKYKL